jgi:hypothetical protein
MAITDKFPSLEEVRNLSDPNFYRIVANGFVFQVCRCVPEATGFDVEIKFPTPLEEQSYHVKVL